MTSLFSVPRIGDVEADLRTGSLVLAEGKGEVAENTALAFSIAVLFVLCVPERTTENPQGMRTNY